MIMSLLFTHNSALSGYNIVVDTYSNNTSRVVVYGKRGQSIIQRVVATHELHLVLKEISRLIADALVKRRAA